jgi:phosphatidylserine/phosphatidylglycerophosphate/cardiolipin synthase-like enzyme
VTPGDGPFSVQVLRTYPARRTGYPFAPDGEFSIARGYVKAFGRAQRIIYLEDQFLWSYAAATAMAAALRRSPDLRVICVIPRYPDPGGPVLGRGSDVGRERVLHELFAAGGDRVAVYDLENRDGVAIYVHAKVCIVDDEWMTVGSDNLNRRSWTHDSESSCAIVDTDTGSDGTTLARATRLRFASEHLQRPETESIAEPDRWFAAFRESAAALDAWHRDDGRGPRPAGHLRVHTAERVPWPSRPLFDLVHRVVLDPDGRPRRLRRAGNG